MRDSAPQQLVRSDTRALYVVDAAVYESARAARLLPALVVPDAAAERARATIALERGLPYEPPPPRRGPRPDPRLVRSLELAARSVTEAAPPALAALYLARIDELELELTLLGAIGRPAEVRDLCRRRYGTGDRVIAGRPLRALAAEILDTVRGADEQRTMPAEGPGSLVESMREVVRAAELDVEVRVDARLVAGAATGDRVIFVAPRRFGAVEARRLCAHEVLGHAVAAANAATQPLRLLSAGTAGAFADQEGLAIVLERHAGALDGARARTLAARVVACDLVHRGASFLETARHLARERGFSVESAVALAERVHRGGGVTRDVAYLEGWTRIEAALARGEATIDELRSGRIGLGALPALRTLSDGGFVRAPIHRPSIAVISNVGASA